MDISVIIPAYNAEDTIKDVLGALSRQSCPPAEIIVVDNGSEDRTVEKVKTFMEENASFNIILEKEGRKGPSAARNKGSLLAKNDFLAFLDADCVPSENWAELLVAELTGGAEAVGGIYKARDTGTFPEDYLNVMQKAYEGRREPLEPDVRSHRFVFGGNFAIKKKIFFEAGKFAEDMELGEDVDLCKRLYRSGVSILYNPAISVLHRRKKNVRRDLLKDFNYGFVQAKFLKEYCDKKIYIIFSGSKTLSFNWPFKMYLYVFSIINILIILAAVGFFNVYIAAFMGIVFVAGIGMKVKSLIIRSGIRVNILRYLLFILYWSVERVIFDIGRLTGSVRYRITCL